MNELNSFDLLASHKRLQDLALKYRANGTIKFGVEVWKFDHMDKIVIKYNCGYVDMSGYENVSESISDESLVSVFDYMENYFRNVLPSKVLNNRVKEGSV